MGEQEDLFARVKPKSPIDFAVVYASQFSIEFLKWLPDNLHVWDAFVKETFAVINRGYKHYSSRTILEFLRHHSVVTETGGEWKLNNNIQPYLPRLFDIMYPAHAGMFEYRVTTKPKGK